MGETEVSTTVPGTGDRPKRGFAALSPERRREIASAGGKTAQARGTGHRFTSEEAQAAGRIGGKISRRNKKTG